MRHLVDPDQPLEHRRREDGAAPNLIAAIDLEPPLEHRVLQADALDAAAEGGDQIADDAPLAGHQRQAGAGAVQFEAADDAGEHLEPLMVEEPQLGQDEPDALAGAGEHVIDGGRRERLDQTCRREDPQVAGRTGQGRRRLTLPFARDVA